MTSLAYDDKTVDLPFGKMTSFEELYVDYNVESKDQWTRIRMMIHIKKPVILKHLKLEQARSFKSGEKIFCNGFQSWSESREFDLDESIPRLSAFAAPYLKYYGDAYIDLVNRKKGNFHSWTYAFIRKGEKIEFIGSLKEQTAFTLIQYDTQKGLISIEKDCKNLELAHSFPILDILLCTAKEHWVFNTYFEKMEIPLPTAPPLTGWTSWYHYYTNISEDIILQNVNAFTEKKAAIDIIQIDDGYQKAVGDWLEIRPDFPNGLARLARQIKQAGYKAGLWIAPFVCSAKSNVFQKHKDWLIQDSKGTPVKVGYNPYWGGWFYALNFYKREVQDYLMTVFKTVLLKWNYDLLKLDFLYAACIKPPSHKTRGQVMSEVMDFIRRTVGDKWILACGVPLGSAFGKVDYCRIGADIHLKWEHALLKFLGNRERVSTILALRTVLGRWQLNNRAFHNDPDVILLRDKQLQLSPVQQYTILLINTLLGNLIFTSDLVSNYSEEQWAEFQSIYKWRNSKIETVKAISKDQYLILFKNDHKNWICACNLSTKAQQFNIRKKVISLQPFESMILGK